jgi:hypothetical protein
MLVGNSTSTLGHAREKLELNPGSCSWETFPQNSVMLVGMTGGHRFCPMKIPQFIREVAELGMQERAGEFQERDGFPTTPRWAGDTNRFMDENPAARVWPGEIGRSRVSLETVSAVTLPDE